MSTGNTTTIPKDEAELKPEKPKRKSVPAKKAAAKKATPKKKSPSTKKAKRKPRKKKNLLKKAFQRIGEYFLELAA